jgi:hypothetical protein
MGQVVSLAKATVAGPVAAPIDCTDPAFLDVAESPYHDWILGELVNRFPSGASSGTPS